MKFVMLANEDVYNKYEVEIDDDLAWRFEQFINKRLRPEEPWVQITTAMLEQLVNDIVSTPFLDISDLEDDKDVTYEWDRALNFKEVRKSVDLSDYLYVLLTDAVNENFVETISGCFIDHEFVMEEN